MRWKTNSRPSATRRWLQGPPNSGKSWPRAPRSTICSCPAFATVREASRRTLGLRHFDVQLIGGMILHDGKIAEMRTGEGKTLVATLAGLPQCA